MSKITYLPLAGIVFAILIYASASPYSGEADRISGSLEAMKLTNLPKVEDSSNHVLHDPAAIEFGKQLFFDPRLSRNGQVACATCHQPNKVFSDGKTVAKALATGSRNTPSLLGVAHNDWFFWDGRKDSLWSQTLEPLENPAEHGMTRTGIARLLLQDQTYRQQFIKLFGKQPASEWLQGLPENATPNGTLAQLQAWKQLDSAQRRQIDRIFANTGKAIAAFVSTLEPAPNQLDSSLDSLPENVIAGARLFTGKAQCIVCHSGPLFTNQSFQNISSGTTGKDSGRAAVLDKVRHDRFNCTGEYSDAAKSHCNELKYLPRSRHALIGAFKVPGLRNVALTAPYFHDGRLQTLEEVVDYYVEASNKEDKDNDLPVIQLTEQEKAELVSFLHSL